MLVTPLSAVNWTMTPLGVWVSPPSLLPRSGRGDVGRPQLSGAVLRPLAARTEPFPQGKAENALESKAYHAEFQHKKASSDYNLNFPANTTSTFTS